VSRKERKMKDTPGRWYERIMGKDLQEHQDAPAASAPEPRPAVLRPSGRTGQLIQACRCGRRAVYSKKFKRWIHVAPNAEHPAVVR